MTPAELAIAVRTLPDTSKMVGTTRGACFGTSLTGTLGCRGLIDWPPRPHRRCIVRCDDEFNPHTAVMDAET